MEATNLCAMLETYLTLSRGRLRPMTIDLLRRAWRHLIRAVGDIPPSRFGLAEAQRFAGYLVDANLSPATRNIMLKSVRPIFRLAWRQGLLERDPFEHLPLFRVPRSNIRVYTADEVRRLVRAAPSTIWEARIRLAATAGLRKGEILNLTLDDIDFDAGRIKIQEKANTARTWAWTVKDYDCREVPLTRETADILSAIVCELPEGMPYVCLEATRYLTLAVRMQGGPLPHTVRMRPDGNFARPWKRMLYRAGITSGTFHDLRRTAITAWICAGLPVQDVQALAGHSAVETTLEYYAAQQSGRFDAAASAAVI